MGVFMNKITIVKSLIWKLSEGFGVQGITFVISLLLARLLTPEDYGVISMTTIFITLSNVLIQSGLSASILQKKEPDALDFSTSLIATFVVSIMIYCLLIMFSPQISDFFNMPLLSPVLRVLAFKIIIDAFFSIINAYASKTLQYNKSFFSSTTASLVSGIVGIVMALNGLGVWSLVVQQLLKSLLSCVLLTILLRWIPKWKFSFMRLKTLLQYGTNILLSDLINNIFLNIRTILIGKFFTSSDLGIYNRGRQFPQFIMTNVNDAIQSVMFVAYSNQQDNRDTLKQMTRKSMKISSFIIFPMMIGLAVLARPLILLILTETWSDSIIFIQITSLSFMLMPIHTTNLQVIKATGNSKLILKLELVRKIIELFVLMISFKFGLITIALGELLTTVISLIINLNPNKRIISYGLREQLEDFMPSIICSFLMGMIIYPIQIIIDNKLLIIIISILIGVLFYIFINFIFNRKTMQYAIKTMKEFKSIK